VEGSPAGVAHSTAADEVAAMTEHDASTALRLVAVALRSQLSPAEESFFSASALEDLLDRHGPAVVDQLVIWAEHSDRMRRMLSLVYHYDLDRGVSHRINLMLVRHCLPSWTGSVGGERPLRPPLRD
jgi:hypothetical protein